MRWFRKTKTDYPSAVPEPQHPFESRGCLFDAAEKAFFGVLSEILADQYRVLGKVGLNCLLNVDSDLPEPSRQTLLQELSVHCLDFVICDNDDFKIMGGVVLEEMTDDEVGRRVFDTFIDRSLNAAGIPVVHLPIKNEYVAQEIKVEISRCIFLEWKANGGEAQTVPAKPSQNKSRSPSVSSNGSPMGYCPECGAAYVKRQAKSGKYAGKFFLACSNYPKCKNLRLIKAQPPTQGAASEGASQPSFDLK